MNITGVHLKTHLIKEKFIFVVPQDLFEGRPRLELMARVAGDEVLHVH